MKRCENCGLIISAKKGRRHKQRCNRVQEYKREQTLRRENNMPIRNAEVEEDAE